jgi:hypothetical protein
MGNDLVKRAAESDDLRWFARGELTDPPQGGTGHNRAKKPFPKPRRLGRAKARIAPDTRFIVDVRQVLGLSSGGASAGGGGGGGGAPLPQQQLTVAQLAQKDFLFASAAVDEDGPGAALGAGAGAGAGAGTGAGAGAGADAGAGAGAAGGAGAWAGIFARLGWLIRATS